MKIIEIKVDDTIDIDHLKENLIALADFSSNLTDIEKEAITNACKKENKDSIYVRLPKDWEGIDPNHMYHVVTKYTFMAGEVTQLEHDLICNLCVAIEKITGKPIKSE